jgi:tRNA(Ile)-lysidine synthase
MSTAAVFEQRLAASFPYSQWAEAGVLVAFSAGPDSTALLAALATFRPTDATGKLVAAHFNHRLRGAESDADEAQAVASAERLRVECVVGRGDAATAADERGDGIEEAARDQRYRFLTETAMRLGLRYIATAHTLDDQAETVLHRLLRGTGLGGLAGIPRVRALAGGTISLIRPLLKFRRSEVLEYLRECDLPYRVDASNNDVRFTRNRLRHALLPQLACDYNPRIVEALARLADQADAHRRLSETLLEPLVDRALMRNDRNGVEIECRAFQQSSREQVREAIVVLWRQCDLPEQAMGFDEWNRLTDLAVDATPRTTDFPGAIRARKQGTSLMLTRPKTT